MAEPLSVLLVDDHALIRAGVRAQLERVPQRITVVGEAEDVPGNRRRPRTKTRCGAARRAPAWR